jgi:hypothetical protein
MARSGACDEARELAGELALGIADGEDRARVLEHAAECSDCRRELERLSVLADELLLLAPEREPPTGFEVRVLRAVQPRPAPRRRLRRLLPVAAAALAAAAVTAGSLLYAFRDDRRLADHYRATLAEAHGSYFAAVRLHDAAGAPGGVVFLYRGSPSWMVVTVAPPYRAAARRAELVAVGGRRVPLTRYRLGDGAWGGAVPLDLRRLAAVHLVGSDGRSVLEAYLPGGS